MKTLLAGAAMVAFASVATPAWAETGNHSCAVWLSNHDDRNGNALNEMGRQEDAFLMGFVSVFANSTAIWAKALLFVADYCGRHTCFPQRRHRHSESSKPEGDPRRSASLTSSRT